MKKEKETETQLITGCIAIIIFLMIVMAVMGKNYHQEKEKLVQEKMELGTAICDEVYDAEFVSYEYGELTCKQKEDKQMIPYNCIIVQKVGR